VGGGVVVGGAGGSDVVATGGSDVVAAGGPDVVAAGESDGVAAGGSAGRGPTGAMLITCWKSGNGGSPTRVTVGRGLDEEVEDGDVVVVVVTSGFWLG
jgi:hypothetical protein